MKPIEEVTEQEIYDFQMGLIEDDLISACKDLKPTSYEILQATTLKSLSEMVNFEIEKNLQPIGGLLYAEGLYCQAMFKKQSLTTHQPML